MGDTTLPTLSNKSGSQMWGKGMGSAAENPGRGSKLPPGQQEESEGPAEPPAPSHHSIPKTEFQNGGRVKTFPAPMPHVPLGPATRWPAAQAAYRGQLPFFPSEHLRSPGELTAVTWDPANEECQVAAGHTKAQALEPTGTKERPLVKMGREAGAEQHILNWLWSCNHHLPPLGCWM